MQARLPCHPLDAVLRRKLHPGVAAMKIVMLSEPGWASPAEIRCP
jgi:hypothetical protein